MNYDNEIISLLIIITIVFINRNILYTNFNIVVMTFMPHNIVRVEPIQESITYTTDVETVNNSNINGMVMKLKIIYILFRSEKINIK